MCSDYRCPLQQALFSRFQTIDPRGENRLNRCRHVQGFSRVDEPIGTTLARQRTSLHQRANAFLEEERTACPARIRT